MLANIFLHAGLFLLLPLQAQSALEQNSSLPPTAQSHQSNSVSSFSSDWEFGVPSPSEIVDTESEGAPNLGTLLSEKLVPDPRSEFTGNEDGGGMGLIGKADEFCLGGLLARINRRAVNYGICGALFGATAGCLLAIIPVYFCNEQIQDLGEQSDFQAPDITILAIPAALVGTPPGCVLGGGTGAAAGVISAFVFPHEPSPADPDDSQTVGEDVLPDGSDGDADDQDHSVIRKKKRTPRKATEERDAGKDRSRKDRTERDGSDNFRPQPDPTQRDSSSDSESNTGIKNPNAHVEDVNQAPAIDGSQETKDNSAGVRKPNIKDRETSPENRVERSKEEEPSDGPVVPKDEASPGKDKKKKGKKAKKKDRKPSKPAPAEGTLDPDNKSGDPFAPKQ